MNNSLCSSYRSDGNSPQGIYQQFNRKSKIPNWYYSVQYCIHPDLSGLAAGQMLLGGLEDGSNESVMKYWLKVYQQR
jgi:hypothetical protein